MAASGKRKKAKRVARAKKRIKKQQKNIKKLAPMQGPFRSPKLRPWHKRKTRNWKHAQRAKVLHRRHRRRLWARNENASSKSGATSSHAVLKNTKPQWRS